MKKWSPTECDNGEKGKTVYQIVVPTVHRQKAHDLPMSGHLGIPKTYNNILQHFYWPGLKRDVAKWCKECHTCQLVVNRTKIFCRALYTPYQLLMNIFLHIR